MIRNRYMAAVNDKPWWLAGGIPASACVAAYQAKGASSYEASKVNLANPGTNTLTELTTPPTYSASVGWTWTYNNGKYLDTGLKAKSTWSFAVFCANTGTDNGSVIGTWETGVARSFFVGPNGTGQNNFGHGGGNAAAGGINGTNVCFIGTSAKRSLYRNGVYVRSQSAWLDANESTYSILIGHGRYNSCPGPTITSASIYNIDIEPYVSALTTAMNAL